MSNHYLNDPHWQNDIVFQPQPGPKVLGFIAFLLVAVPGIILMVMVYFGQNFFPCITDPSLPTLTPFGCDTERATDYYALQTLPTLALIFAIPVSIIMGIIAIVKDSGRGWGWLALTPIPVWMFLGFVGSLFK